MCVIMLHEPGKKLPEIDQFKLAWDTNADGAGIAYIRNNTVHVQKGFMQYNVFLRNYHKLNFTEDDQFMVHFRLGTQGRKVPSNTHPFPLSSNTVNLKRLNYTAPIVVAHNGVLWHNRKEEHISDTMEAIKHHLASCVTPKSILSKGLQHLIDVYGKSSRWAFMLPDQIIRIGTWHLENEIWYSKKLFKPAKGGLSITYVPPNQRGNIRNGGGYRANRVKCSICQFHVLKTYATVIDANDYICNFCVRHTTQEDFIDGHHSA